MKEKEIRVIRISKEAVKELLFESLMEKGAELFGLSKNHDAWFGMSWDEETGDLIYTANKEGESVDFDYILENVPITTESLFTSKPKRYITVNQTAHKQK